MEWYYHAIDYIITFYGIHEMQYKSSGEIFIICIQHHKVSGHLLKEVGQSPVTSWHCMYDQQLQLLAL